MRVQDIFETILTDVEAARLASRAAITVSQRIYDGAKSDHLIEISDHGDFLLYGLDKLGLASIIPELSDCCLLFGKKQANTVGSSGGVYKFEEPILGYNSAIAFWGIREITDKAVASFVNSTEFITIFKHEFIHVLDGIRSDEKSKSHPAEDQTRYYNSDAELNAYFHDIASPLTGIIDEIAKGYGSASELADLYDISGDFKRDLKRMLGTDMATRRFVSYLTYENRRKIIRRLARLHGEVVRLLAQEKAKSSA